MDTTCDKNFVLIVSASSEGSDSPAHMHSLARAFAYRKQNQRTIVPDALK